MDKRSFQCQKAYGNSDNLFFEDNTILWTSPIAAILRLAGLNQDTVGACVVRYNSWNCANANVTELWDIHGFQNWPGNGQTGTMIVEYYGNRATNFTGFRWIGHRGGWGLFHNNVVSGPGGAGIEVNQYDVLVTLAEVAKTGNWNQGGEINNTYVFNNISNGVVKDMYPGRCGDAGKVAPNVAYWNYNPSFNGTTGIGRGTNAPTGNCQRWRRLLGC